MATTTIWVPGASARVGGNLDIDFNINEVVSPRIMEIIKGNEIFFRVLGSNEEYNLKATFYISFPTISILNNEQLYLKRFSLNLKFVHGPSPLTLFLYDGLDEVKSFANPVFSPSFEYVFERAHKINRSLLMAIELNIPPNEGTIIKIANASFDFKSLSTDALSPDAFLLFLKGR